MSVDKHADPNTSSHGTSGGTRNGWPRFFCWRSLCETLKETEVTPEMVHRTKFSVCIPAYNRARHLAPLLDSILNQGYDDFEIVICEDHSPEREAIEVIAHDYVRNSPCKIRFYLNEQNLGYDANIRNLVEKAEGEFCFFMGNDDLMCPNALEIAADLIDRHENLGVIVRGYAWFDETPDRIAAEVRYFSEERSFSAGAEAISICFRRSGVISGYIVHRDSAQAVATSRFDGSLYYQMHLTANVLVSRSAAFTPALLVLCRNCEPPDFGNSTTEEGTFVPGKYTPEARLHMVAGALSIIKSLKEQRGIDLVDVVIRDYANYFYPYIRDQLNTSPRQFFSLYRRFGKMGFSKYWLFHVYFVLGYVLGARRFDACIKLGRRALGHSPRFGILSN
jgi:abequosyltransferase